MATAPTYDSTGVEFTAFQPSSSPVVQLLHDLRVAYRSFNPDSKNGVVLIPTCFSGLINTTLTFSTSPNDSLAKYHVVVVAMLGNGESSSPSNKSMFPEPGELRYQDLVNAQHALLTQHLNVQGLEAVVGFSMAGQQAYHWAVMYPDFVKRIVAICTSAKTSPHNYAFLEGPIGSLVNSLDYVAWKAMKQKLARGEDVGTNLKEVKPKAGLKAFRRAYSAWLTSHYWFRRRLWADIEGGMGFKTVEKWIQAGEEGYLGWDAEDLLVLARMWQMGDIGSVIPGNESALTELGGGVGDKDLYTKALGSIKAKVLVMPCRTDQYFPPEDGEIEMKYLNHGTFAPIESVWGHIAGGGANPKDVESMNRKIGQFMKDEEVEVTERFAGLQIR